jgi:hypothetical protein
MAKKIASLYAEISGDTSKLDKSLGDTKTQLSGFKSGLTSSLEGLTGFNIGALGAAAAAGALAKGFQFAIDEAMQSERATAKLNQVLESTHGVSGMTTTSVENLSKSLSDMSGIDDDVITGASSLMLTFTSIGKEIFPQTMTAALDMSSALGQDLQSSVIQLGKALNDPIQGMTALKRVGVSFTQSQQDQIKTLQQSGHLLEAQTLILNELSTEFGGQAAAAANTYEGSINKLNVTVTDLAKAIGLGLIPYLNNAATAMNLLLTWDTKVRTAMQNQGAAVTNAATSYAQYKAGIEATNIAGWNAIPVMTKFDQWMKGNDENVNHFAGSLRIMSQAEWDAINTKASDVGVTTQLIPTYQSAEQAAINEAKATNEMAVASGNAADEMKNIWIAANGATEQGLKFGTAINDLKGATDNLKTAQAEWGQSLASDVKSQLETAGLKGDDLRKAVGLLDQQFGTNMQQRDDYKQAITDIVDQYKKTKDLEDFRIGVGEIGTAFQDMNQPIVDAKLAVETFQKALNDLTAKTYVVDVVTHFSGNVPSISSGSAASNSNPITSNPTHANPNAGAAMGANFTVPSGYPGDRFMLGVSSGEHVSVTPASGNNEMIALLRVIAGNKINERVLATTIVAAMQR